MYDNTLLASPPPIPPAPPIKQKQSKLGIASFVISLLALLLVCAGFVISFGYGFSLASQNPYDYQSLIDQNSPTILIASVLLLCSPGLSLLGVGLGIAAMVQKTEKKTFGIIGLVINALILISVCCLFLIGLLAQSGSIAM